MTEASKEKKVSQLLRYLESVEMQAVPYPTPQKCSFPDLFPVINGEPHRYYSLTVLASDSASATFELYVIGQVT